MAITCTINSPTRGDYTAVRTAVPGKLKYVTFNREVGENGTPHLQLFARANNQLKTKAWQEALGGRCIAIQRVTAREDARDYAQGFEIKTNRQERRLGSQTEDQLYEEYGTYVTETGKKTNEPSTVCPRPDLPALAAIPADRNQR